MKRSYWAFIVIMIVLILDQALKIYIKTTFGIGEGFKIFGLDWARIYFVENEGMAYGLTIGGEYGKLILSVFRIIMVIVLLVILSKLIKTREKLSLIISFSLIIAGAIGNILDSAFYGMIFSETPRFHGGVAQMFPPEGGYAGFLHGKVVDMFYFPMINTHFPEWFPFWGGERFVFFQPIFNIADSAITTGVVSLLVFNRSFFVSKKEEEKPVENIESKEVEKSIDIIDKTEEE